MKSNTKRKFQKGGRKLSIADIETSRKLTPGDIRPVNSESNNNLFVMAKAIEERRALEQARDKEGTISPTKQKSALSKALSIATHPATALSYKLQGRNIPDNLEADPNKLDMATSILNPMFYAGAVGRTAKNLFSGSTYKDAGNGVIEGILNLAGDQVPSSIEGSGMRTLGRVGDALAAIPAAQGFRKLPIKGINIPDEVKSFNRLDASHPLINMWNEAIGSGYYRGTLGATGLAVANRLAPIVSKTPVLKDIYKDLAYKIGSQSSGSTRDLNEILKAFKKPRTYLAVDEEGKEFMKDVDLPYKGQLSPYPKEYGERNLMKNYVYGDDTGFTPTDRPTFGLERYEQRYPNMKKYDLATKIDKVDIDATMNLLRSNKAFANRMQNLNPEQIKPLLTRYLNKKGSLSFGTNMDALGAYDDIAGHAGKFHLDEAGNIKYTAQDIWKFTPEDYNKKWVQPSMDVSPSNYMHSKQASLLDKAGKPVILSKEVPVNLPENTAVRPEITERIRRKLFARGIPYNGEISHGIYGPAYTENKALDIWYNGYPKQQNLKQSWNDGMEDFDVPESPYPGDYFGTSDPDYEWKKGGTIFSTKGYKKNSPDRNNPYNIIPSGNITMENVEFPVLGTDETGHQILMQPGQNYQFPGNQVFEVPMKKQQQGGLWNSNKVGYIDSTLNANRNLDWVKRLYEKNTPTIQLPNEPYPSTHFMESGDSRVYPTIVRENGKLKYLGNKAFDYADQTKSFIQFPNDQMAQWFGENYKKGTGVLKKQQQGGFSGKEVYDFLFDDEDDNIEFDADIADQQASAAQEQKLTLDKERDQLNQEKLAFKDQQDYANAMQIATGNYDEAFGDYRRRKQMENGFMPTIGNTSFRAEGSEKGNFAFNYLQGKGIAPHVAAGIVGNLEQESGNFRDDVISGQTTGDYGTAFGIAQWRGKRKTELENFAKSQHRDPWDLQTQLDFVIHESSQRGDLQAASQAKTSGEAAYIFAKRYEKPKVIDPYRIKYAQNYHK